MDCGWGRHTVLFGWETETSGELCESVDIVMCGSVEVEGIIRTGDILCDVIRGIGDVTCEIDDVKRLSVGMA